MKDPGPLASPYAFFTFFSNNIFTLHNLVHQPCILLLFLYGFIIKSLFAFVKFKTVIFYKKQRFFSDFNFAFRSFFSKLVETHERTSQNRTISIKRFFVQLSIFLNNSNHPSLCQIIFSKEAETPLANQTSDSFLAPFSIIFPLNDPFSRFILSIMSKEVVPPLPFQVTKNAI